jgi:hypothetical protein
MNNAIVFLQIANFKNENDSNWLELDKLIQQIDFSEETTSEDLRKLFLPFENYPEHDGFGVLWTLLHTVESFKGYENLLLQSLEKKPSMMTLEMVLRIINYNKTNSPEVPLTEDLIRTVKLIKKAELSPDLQELINLILHNNK